MKRAIHIISWSALAALALGSLGCTLTADPPYVVGGGVVVDSDVTYADVGAAPIEVELGTYPQAYYGGRPFYFYGDRWYYRDGGRWAYYRNEPVELSRQRSYIQRAPMAPRGVVQAPMAHGWAGRVGRRVEQAPPATRRAPAAQRRYVGHPQSPRR
jgi:hypothetical protein